jgi:hypothetical protein
MKINALLLLALLLSVHAQDAVVQQPKTAVDVSRAEQRKLESQKKQAEDILKEKPVITYSGFLQEVKNAENKSKLLSLRQPVDPKNDSKNVLFDIHTNRPKGSVLFSLNF